MKVDLKQLQSMNEYRQKLFWERSRLLNVPFRSYHDLKLNFRKIGAINYHIRSYIHKNKQLPAPRSPAFDEVFVDESEGGPSIETAPPNIKNEPDSTSIDSDDDSVVTTLLEDYILTSRQGHRYLLRSFADRYKFLQNCKYCLLMRTISSQTDTTPHAC